jgi:galactonate dehydratase
MRRFAPIVDARWHTVRVTLRTCWSFVELVDAEGRIGAGEGTLAAHEAAIARRFAACRPALIGRAPDDLEPVAARSPGDALAAFAVASAIDQAAWDLVAQRRGASMSETLGGRRRERVRLYANLNRGTGVRTPEGFAGQARRAVADGFDAVKIAPFDGVTLRGDERAPVDDALLDAAFARIAAVRAEIGAKRQLLVDCHWRLNRRTAEAVLDATAPYRLYWLECPVPERAELLGTLCALRARANAHGVRLAGCEQMSLVGGFLPYARAGAYDVMMPDVKYAGGLREMLAIADVLDEHGVGFSPHNPSGPVAHAASLHVCATVRNVELLEVQYRETPYFGALVAHALPEPTNGASDVPRTPGLGVKLDPAAVAALRVAPDAPPPSGETAA